MKILITGKNSYIGTSFKKWVEKYDGKYIVDTIDVKDERWIKKDFSEYDVIFHTAGIAHMKETKQNAELYYKVNRDLAYEIAKKAKIDGVKQFILLSSMSVYGIDNGIITQDTKPEPKSNYGKSKLQAEELVIPLEDVNFNVVVVRPPMVYGKGCKGNYVRLSKLALKTPFFPNIKNQRSMIYIDNLNEFIRLVIDDCAVGIFYPQNQAYVCTSEMVRIISEVHGKQMILTQAFNRVLCLLNLATLNKLFGKLVYEKQISEYKNNYCIKNFEESIEETELNRG